MGPSPLSRRSALRIACLSTASVCLSSLPAYALKPGKPSKERLLSKTIESKTPEEIEEEKARVAEEKRLRLEKQRELQASADRRKAGLEDDEGPGVEIESNLRGQYYFPTARKRYLPRVKLAWETLPDVEKAAKSSEWLDVSNLSSEILTDAVLPMRLYASSLAGGGLSINAKFIETMNEQADAYEGALKKLKKAVKKKETDKVLDMLDDMKVAIAKYRETGKLQAPDFGIGEIATDAKVGSGFSNNNSALYGRNKTVKGITGG